MSSEGNTPDDQSIPDEAQLWRRIPGQHMIRDSSGVLRISSAAFDNDTNGSPMSVVLGDDVLRAGRAANSVIGSLVNFGLASVTAEFLRNLDQGVTRDPIENEPAHALVHGKKSRSTRQRMAKEAVWIIRHPMLANEPS